MTAPDDWAGSLPRVARARARAEAREVARVEDLMRRLAEWHRLSVVTRVTVTRGALGDVYWIHGRGPDGSEVQMVSRSRESDRVCRQILR